MQIGSDIVVPTSPSPLMLSDRLITLAQEADRAGHASIAHRLVNLAYAVFETATPARRQNGGRRRG
jgi:hypothetical protein